MIEFPYSSPIILNDTVYLAYGGHTGTSTAAQRSAAYLIAEMQATAEIGTFLLPIIVTGTFPPPWGHLTLPYSHVHRVLDVTFLTPESDCSCDLDTVDGCAFIFDDTYGYIDVRQLADSGYCGCGCYRTPYQVRVTWEAGLPTGTANLPNVLLALTIVAEINLNEIIDPSANEGVGDVGILEFSNQEYQEKRKELRNTAFGMSARANKAAQLLRSLKRFRALKL